MNQEKEIFYITSSELRKSLENIDKIRRRSYLVDGLIEAYHLDTHPKFHYIQPELATDEQLSSAHDRDYLEFLKFIANIHPDDQLTYREQMDLYQIGYECPPFEQLPNFCQLIGGASITAAKCLDPLKNDIAINFSGGWHHASRMSYFHREFSDSRNDLERSEASGFCYINDIVMAINELRKKFDRICYIDFDLHHGDGVQDAFFCSSKVLTVSFHKYEKGFFPINSGGLEEMGETWGRGFNINIPLHHGINDEQYLSLFTRIFPMISSTFSPDVFIIQCGADTLFNDPMKSFNLTSKSILQCIQQIIDLNKPMILLGGGGYHIADTARLWTLITSISLKQTIDYDIPEHDYFTFYGPDFTLDTWPGNRSNRNTSTYLDSLIDYIERNQIVLMKKHFSSNENK